MAKSRDCQTSRTRFQFSTLALLTGVTLASLVAVGLGVISGGAFLLPFLQALLVYPFYVVLILRGHWTKTVLIMLYWAFLNALLVSILSMQTADWMESRVLLGGLYRDEMFRWIQTGIGPESDIGQFLPEHLFHLLLFSILTVITAGFLGLAMGASLLNYMSYYVGSLLSHSSCFWLTLSLAWPAWAALRVGGFILVAITLTTLLFNRWGLCPVQVRKVSMAVLFGSLLLVADVLLKWILAPFWREWLAPSVRFGIFN